MPVPIPCPGCGRKLRIPDAMLGRRVKCPACSRSFAAVDPAQPPPPPPDDNPFGAMGARSPGAQAPSHFGFNPDEEPARIPGVRSSWRLVRFGLNCVSLGIFCNILAGIIIGVMVLLTFQETLLIDLIKVTGGLASLGFLGCLGLLFFVSVVSSLVGVGLCIGARAQAGRSRW